MTQKALSRPPVLANVLRYLLWPLHMIIAMAITLWGAQQGCIILYFNLAYLFMVVSLFGLEKVVPFEQAWLKPDGQNLPSLLHTLTSKGTVQALFAVSAMLGIAEVIVPLEEHSGTIWPSDWPLMIQVMLGLLIAEFGLYWTHRLSHEVAFFWRFHAIHHAVTRLWFFNTGRFHFVDSLLSIVAALWLLLLFEAPMEVFQWVSITTAFIGILTHCNVDMRCGWLNLLVNTPELHRWHHSKHLHEGNRNYGENLMLWDHVFRSWYHAEYRPSKDIGIKELSPADFWGQLLWPFLTDRKRQQRVPGYQAAPFQRESHRPPNKK